jgi:hypothetical protein
MDKTKDSSKYQTRRYSERINRENKIGLHEFEAK